VQKFQTKKRDEVEGLIMPVGTSPEPIILSISALQPKRVMFLPTAQTRHLLDRIIEDTGLRASQYSDRLIDGSNVLDIYRRIKETIELWSDFSAIGIDITAGKKVMSAASAIAGTIVNTRLFYVDSERYLPKLRRPEPGSEYLVEIPNPLEVFGDLKDNQARALFQNGDYSASSELWNELVTRTPDPRGFEVCYLLARAYGAWDQLHFKEALEYIINVNQKISQYDASCYPESIFVQREKLVAQQHILELLTQISTREVKNNSQEINDIGLLRDDMRLYILVRELYAHAARHTRYKQFNSAVLVYYRLAELLAQRRLSFYGIDPANALYQNLPHGLEPQQLLERINQKQKQMHKDLKMAYQFNELPIKIGMIQAYIMLCIFEDAYTENMRLQKFNGIMSIRNESIFAHGFSFVSEKRLREVKTEIDERLRLFWIAEKFDLGQVDTLQDHHQFIGRI
jgi:CRISPR-associated protein (TIGR02710 family)